METYDYDTWRGLPKEEQLSILEKYYPIGMYVESKCSGKYKIIEYKYSIFNYYYLNLDSFDEKGIIPFLCFDVKPDLRRNRLEKLKKLGI